MKFFSKLKKLFAEEESKYPKNFCERFDSLESLVKYVSSTTDFDRHYIYVYLGESKHLASLISNDTIYGEKAISDLSLVYVGDCYCSNNSVVLKDTPFFPDTLGDLMSVYYKLDPTKERKCLYRPENKGLYEINGFVLAKNNLYICRK